MSNVIDLDRHRVLPFRRFRPGDAVRLLNTGERAIVYVASDDGRCIIDMLDGRRRAVRANEIDREGT